MQVGLVGQPERAPQSESPGQRKELVGVGGG